MVSAQTWEAAFLLSWISGRCQQGTPPISYTGAHFQGPLERGHLYSPPRDGV